MINPFDARIVMYLNHFARRSWAFDAFFVLCSNNLLRVAGIVPLYWWVWLGDRQEQDPDKNEQHQILLFGMIGCLFALLLSRTISMILPFRVRPLHDPTLHFQVPYGQGTQVLIGWSSFPSDHAAVYFTLALCLYLVSRRLGLVALCWTLFVTCLPRIYLGLHYPSDIAGGALLAIGIAYLGQISWIRKPMTLPILNWHQAHPGPFYALFFLFSLQLATAFESVILFNRYFIAVAHRAASLIR